MICDLHCDSQQSEINQQIQTMFEQGVMEPSTSPIIPLLIILKKKFKCIWRKETLSDTYPFSNMTDILDQLGIVQEFLFCRDPGVNCKYSNHTKVGTTNHYTELS
jgi:hypothetical protein